MQVLTKIQEVGGSFEIMVTETKSKKSKSVKTQNRLGTIRSIVDKIDIHVKTRDIDLLKGVFLHYF